MRRIFVLILILFSISNAGCGGYSFHSYHQYTIKALLVDTSLPAQNFPIRIVYPYDHYGIFYFWNAPDPVDGKLDTLGQVTIEIAGFYKPHLVVGSTIFSLDEEILMNGGKPFKFPNREDDVQYQKNRSLYKIYKLPEKKYPDVDIVISYQN